MARRRSPSRPSRKNPRSSRGHVSYAVRGYGNRPSDFRPVKARGSDPLAVLLREPRGAIREFPLAFVLGAGVAGYVFARITA